MKDFLNGRRSQWKTTTVEDDHNVRLEWSLNFVNPKKHTFTLEYQTFVMFVHKVKHETLVIYIVHCHPSPCLAQT